VRRGGHHVSRTFWTPLLLMDAAKGRAPVHYSSQTVNMSRTFVKCFCTRVSLHQCGKHRGSVSKLAERLTYGSR